MKNKIFLFLLGSIAFGQIDYHSQIQPIFDNNCSGYCHVNGGSYTGNLDLSSYDDLVSGDSNHGSVITPGDSENSIIIQKLSANPPFGDQMPQGGSPLSEYLISLIADWIDEGANETPLEISYKTIQTPKKIKLFKNYPNPFNPSTTLTWNQNQIDNLDLCVYTLSGQMVEHKILGEYGTGYHQFLWQPQDISSGVYILNIKGKNLFASKKIIYSK